MAEKAEKAQPPANPGNAKYLSNRVVQEYLTSNFGENAVKVIKAASGEITDDALAEKCKLKVSEIRRVLNKLHNTRLAAYTRSKDKDTGWYSYLWKVDLSSVYQVLDKTMQTEIDSLNQKFEESTTVFSYYCPKCSKNNVIEFESASNLAFKCPNCKKNLRANKSDHDCIVEQLKELRKRQSALKEMVEKEQLKQ